MACAVFTGMASISQAMISPSLQRDAKEWLEIKVISVKTDPEIAARSRSPAKVAAKAEILKVFKTNANLKAGEVIEIEYNYDPKPKYSADGKTLLGPGSPPLLRQGLKTYAFLNSDVDDGSSHTDDKSSHADGAGDTPNFVPGSQAWSFAPPFGISQEQRDELGMKAPMPPSGPPPSIPPSVRASMQARQGMPPPPPNMPPPPPPNMPPPPPPNMMPPNYGAQIPAADLSAPPPPIDSGAVDDGVDDSNNSDDAG